MSKLALALGLVLASGLNAAETVVFWHFGQEETSRLEPHGAVHRDEPGPRPPEFPDFEPGNTAVRLDGRGAHFRFPDPGDASPFDFTNGDSITLEAWVHLADIKTGENSYVIGKGRTHAKGFPRDNQNWALRVREVDGDVRVSFLFFSAATKTQQGEWHRWTSDAGFKAGSGWHHVAATYTFGKPQSAVGWLDGRALKGSWDMGGATTRAPVVDNDAIWIGSSQGGSAGNSFRGLLDEIAVHRGILADDILKARFRRARAATEAGNKPLPLPQLTRGKVTVRFHEEMEGHDRWPASAAPLKPPAATWETDLFLIPRLPLRYDDWGIRAAWKSTVLLRAVAQVQLPAGKPRFLIRARGGARLWLDGKLLTQTPFQQGGSDGHGQVPPEPAAPAADCRLHGYGDRESIVTTDVAAGAHTVLLEVLVGSKRFRPETGECCVAVQLDGDKQFRVLSTATEPIWLTDTAWEASSARQEAALEALDSRTRRAAAASQDDFWKQRHTHARTWAVTHPFSAIPDGDSPHVIDRFLADKMKRAVAASKADANARSFHENVLPILRDHCFRCHGDKERGGLRLNSRAAALKAGDSGAAALVPGQPAKSALLARVKADGETRMPPGGAGLKAGQIAALEKWIGEGANWPAAPLRPEEVTLAPLIGDAAFLRRVYLDTVGVPPTAEEARAFLADRADDKRSRLVDELLVDPRWADHWVSYWQDVLAENPNILKPTLNNSGPFRFFLHEALRDGKAMDRFVTELVMMRGGVQEGGSAGFALATDNDAPMAAKAHVLANAFLGVELGCARCHDSPFHSTKQRDLFNLAAMLDRKPLTLPRSSSVPTAFFDKKERPSLIKVSLKPGERIEPSWPFAGLAPVDVAARHLRDPRDSRERLAATLTLPENTRFAPVLVNRVWKRLLGTGLVEPVHDWEGRSPSHPELLSWLAHELVSHDYDLKHVMRLILTSQVYQREARGENGKATAERRFFVEPDRRRLSAEQVVDSLYGAAGVRMQVEPLTFDADGRGQITAFLNLGRPRRAWEFTSLANERDRPSLSLPRAQAVTDVLEAFGWQGSRQSPLSERETDPNLLQPAVLANGILAAWISRLTEASALTEVAVQARTPAELAETLTLRFLSRPPTTAERERLVGLLAPGFEDRLSGKSSRATPIREPRVSWSNHLSEEATRQKLEYSRQSRAGAAPTIRLRPEWRERMEDVVWSLFNLPEFVWLP